MLGGLRELLNSNQVANLEIASQTMGIHDPKDVDDVVRIWLSKWLKENWGKVKIKQSSYSFYGSFSCIKELDDNIGIIFQFHKNNFSYNGAAYRGEIKIIRPGEYTDQGYAANLVIASTYIHKGGEGIILQDESMLKIYGYHSDRVDQLFYPKGNGSFYEVLPYYEFLKHFV